MASVRAAQHEDVNGEVPGIARVLDGLDLDADSDGTPLESARSGLGVDEHDHRQIVGGEGQVEARPESSKAVNEVLDRGREVTCVAPRLEARLDIAERHRHFIGPGDEDVAQLTTGTPGSIPVLDECLLTPADVAQLLLFEPREPVGHDPSGLILGSGSAVVDRGGSTARDTDRRATSLALALQAFTATFFAKIVVRALHEPVPELVVRLEAGDELEHLGRAHLIRREGFAFAHARPALDFMKNAAAKRERQQPIDVLQVLRDRSSQQLAVPSRASSLFHSSSTLRSARLYQPHQLIEGTPKPSPF